MKFCTAKTDSTDGEDESDDGGGCGDGSGDDDNEACIEEHGCDDNNGDEPGENNHGASSNDSPMKKTNTENSVKTMRMIAYNAISEQQDAMMNAVE